MKSSQKPLEYDQISYDKISFLLKLVINSLDLQKLIIFGDLMENKYQRKRNVEELIKSNKRSALKLFLNDEKF
ncbi:hypothetical protein BpHYR1_043260 [Brachionus plicatilis]|uniref:Uncharacterized protein n=1 Tax=Brachionus plicatilis TaxID=10195 RepID=A0A3M7P9N8_BRAPC|nr:hypothetical protein BpHYR1_043260 [Brachionus plicatilis]